MVEKVEDRGRTAGEAGCLKVVLDGDEEKRDGSFDAKLVRDQRGLQPVLWNFTFQLPTPDWAGTSLWGLLTVACSGGQGGPGAQP